MSYESYEEQKVRETQDKVNLLKHKLALAEADLVIAQLRLEADREGYTSEDDD